MSSLAFGHLHLWAPDKINDSFLPTSHSKPNAARHTGGAKEDKEKELLDHQQVWRLLLSSDKPVGQSRSPARADVDVVDLAGHHG